MKLFISFLILALGLSACSSLTLSPTNTQQPTDILLTDTSVPTQLILTTDTSIPTQISSPTADTETPTPSETETPPAATIPPFLTSIPGIAATLTAAFSTPGAEDTLVAEQTKESALEGAQLQGLRPLLSQCPNPSDPPKQTWLDIPVMPQATAGQVVETIVGSYYCFRAPVTVADMESFYQDKLQPPAWMMRADTDGMMEFVGFGQAGIQLLFLVSGPGNKNDLIVMINATSPLAIPTPKP